MKENSQTKSNSQFKKWVHDYGGTNAVAMQLGVTDRCVRLWLKRERSPRTIALKKLVSLSGGRLTLNLLIDATQPLGI